DVVPSMTGVVLSNGRLNVNNALASIGPNWIAAAPTTPGVVIPGGTQDIITTIDPAGLLGGVYTGEVVVETNDPVTPLQTIQVTLTIDGFRSLEANSSSVDFGTVWLGQTGTVALTLINSSNEATVVSDLTIPNTLFNSSVVLPLTVPAFGEMTVDLSFTPTQASSESTVLTVISNAEDNGNIGVALSGVSVEGPSISINPAQYDVALQTGATTTEPMTITNTGDIDLEFSIASEITTPIAPLLRSVEERWDLSETPENGYGLTPISFTEVDMALNAAYPFYDGFEDGTWDKWEQVLGNNVPAVTNTTVYGGSYALTITGSDYFHEGLRLNFGNETPEEVSFALRSSDILNHDAYFNIRSGTQHAVWCFLQGDGDIYINGNETFKYVANEWYHFRLVFDWSNYRIDVYINEQLAITALPFRDQVNSIDKIDIFNYEDSQAWWDEIAIGQDPIAPWLRSSVTTGTIAPGQTLELEAEFDATALVGGQYTGQFVVTSNSPTTPEVLIPVNLTVDGEKRLSVSPNTYDFGDVWQGATQSFELTLSNSGDETTVVTDISIDNVVFSSNALLPLTIPAFGSETITVSYTASQLNIELGVMSIVSDAEDNPELTVSLSGAGVEAPAA
ncbi:MAG: choice-of-anchor D domain-containing protein, partial [Fibrobacterales bacterium]